MFVSHYVLLLFYQAQEELGQLKNRELEKEEELNLFKKKEKEWEEELEILKKQLSEKDEELSSKTASSSGELEQLEEELSKFHEEAKQKEKDRIKDRPEISRILMGVDDMKIQDSLDPYAYENKHQYNTELAHVSQSFAEVANQKLLYHWHLYDLFTRLHLSFTSIILSRH